MRKRKAIFVLFILFTVITGSYSIWLSDQYVVPIIMYHSIDNPHHLSGIVVSPHNFRKQLKFFKKHKYNVISLDMLVAALKEKKRLPKKSVVITFDDGYEDNYTNAFPILKEFGFPATIFVITDLISTEDEYLTWDQLREMEKHGITIGSHTLDHIYLPGVPIK